MRLFANDACLSYQHSDSACVNSFINEELRKVDLSLGANKLFLFFVYVPALGFKPYFEPN